MKKSNISYSFYVLFFLIGIIFIGATCLTAKSMNDEGKNTTITIQQGDSIWGIANKYESFSFLSKEKFVEWVERENHLYSAKLIPGDKLKIPVSKDKLKEKNFRTYASNEILE